ncbi:hypothetical protein FQ192_11970 [Pseudomonas sp. ANT_J12]|uniref:hypothetical protein n=1 Tax=Pseudomonas sp. ANT_J12 TaxID=2597351 RepID=UPI0011F374C9|nr:hypothetical protein [Pseudomonas sp. ANT_J12]KAA0994833.1 hypothetical protein FQ192_11970 [Pseudomonas sp. ANT_J12]
MKSSEVLSVISSVASITGMSLLTANGMVDDLNVRQIAWSIAATMVVVLVGIGCVFACVQVALWGDKKNDFGDLRFVYRCFSGAVVIFIAAVMVIGCSYLLSDLLAMKRLLN